MTSSLSRHQGAQTWITEGKKGSGMKEWRGGAGVEGVEGGCFVNFRDIGRPCMVDLTVLKVCGKQ